MIIALFVFLCISFLLGVLGAYARTHLDDVPAALECYRVSKVVNLIAIVVTITYWCLGN